jgi:signal transduction histidine kinase
LVAAAPVLDPGLIGAVRVKRDIQSVNSAVRRTTIGLIAVVGGIGLFIGLVVAVVISGSLARPLTRLAASARRLGAGDLSTRATDVTGADEIEELAGSFDDMADRVERTVHAQREFVANASHQLRTPLTGMKLRLESAIERADTPEMTHDLSAADREIDRLAATVDRLLVMARTLEEGGSTEVDLHSAAERAAERWRGRAETRGCTLSVDGEPVTAQANVTDVDQIFDNLLENAMTYAPGPIQLQTGTSERRAFLAVRDHGPGIPSEEQAKVTERFYRGRAAPPGGSGLGLAIARDMAERWGGALAVQSARGGGTRV